MKDSYIIVFWSPFPITSTDFCMDYFVSILRRHGDIQCINCKNNQDERTMQLIHHADLLVVIFRQNHLELCHWITDEMYRSANCLYVIVDYFPEKEFDLVHISQEFRIPLSRLACIPYNLEYREAIRKGSIWSYWRTPNSHGIYQAGMDFRKELKRTANLILIALEKQKEGWIL